MKYYVIKNNSIIIAEKEQALTNYYDDVFQLPTDYEQGKYIVENNSLVLNPNYESEKQAKEKERIGNLTVTKRVFALALRDNFNIPYNELKRVIAQSDDALLEWDLCVDLHRNNPLLDIMANEMGISSKMLDYIFQKANGEDVEMPIEEVIA